MEIHTKKQGTCEITTPRRLYYIRWLDAAGVSSSWESPEEVSPELSVVHSVGFILSEGNGSLLLASHIGDESDFAGAQVTGCMQIPQKMIQEKVQLKEYVRHDVNGEYGYS